MSLFRQELHLKTSFLWDIYYY